jgi:hypothetical protein
MVRRRTVAGAVVLAAVVLLGAATGTPWHVNPPSVPDFDIGPMSMPAYTEPPASGEVPDQLPPVDAHSLAWIGWVLVALLAGLVVFLLVRWLMKWRLPVPGQHSELDAPVAEGDIDDEVRQAVANAVDAAITRIQAAGPPRDAVIEAWLELEAAADRVGVIRDPAQTPTEFTAALLSETAAPDEAVARLRRRYHAARFSRHPVSERDVAEARDALGLIAVALSRGHRDAGEPDPPGPSVSEPEATL